MNSRVEFGPTISIRFYSLKIKLCATKFVFQFLRLKILQKETKIQYIINCNNSLTIYIHKSIQQNHYYLHYFNNN